MYQSLLTNVYFVDIYTVPVVSKSPANKWEWVR